MRARPHPAPWHYETNQGNVVIWATRSGNDDKHILGVSQFGPLEQREANARLICSLVNDAEVLVDQNERLRGLVEEAATVAENIISILSDDPDLSVDDVEASAEALLRAIRGPASVDTHPKDGDVEQAPLVSGAVAEGETPNPNQAD